MEYAARADDAGRAGGLLQRMDPRAKLAGLLALILATVASQKLPVTLALFGVALGLALLSGRPVWAMLARLWGGVLLFTGPAVLPALALVPGRALVDLPWVGWAITEPGLRNAVTVLARSETAATFAALLVLTTSWAKLLKALRVLRVPALVVAILGMTYRTIFVLLGLAQDFFLARRARQVGRLSAAQRRQMALSGAGVLFSKSIQLSTEVYEAMQARGFRGELDTLDEFSMRRLDWGLLAVCWLLAAAAIRMGAFV